MKMKNSMIRDKKRRTNVQKYELPRLQLKAILYDQSLSLKVRFQAQEFLNNLPRDSSKTRIKSRCIITGRGRSVLKFCRLSRISFRELASQGLLPGVIKSSW